MRREISLETSRLNMVVEPRTYRDETDLAKMRSMLQAGRKAKNGTYYVHIGDLNWWLFYPPIGEDWWQHIFLWDDPADPSRLLAWALIAPDGETFDIYVQPELRGLPLAMACYAWGAARAAENALSHGAEQTGVMWISQDDTLMDEWLCKQGYTRNRADVSMLRSLTVPILTPTLPDGYTVRGCQGEIEVGPRATAQYSAFTNTIPFDRYVERFRGFMQSPVYDPELDVVAVAPDGQIGSFCIVWSDPVNQVGLFEPVGTHPDFQRRGLGKVVMSEALRRLKERGMKRAIVSTWDGNTPGIKLYEAVGFHITNRLGTYEKKVA
jgi:mycothiol synthase